MYYTEKITPEILRKLQSEEGRREFKTGPDNRIVIARVCHHCSSQYFPRRKNQKYCSTSCRVMACYKRNGYSYKSGRYEKSVKDKESAIVNQTQTEPNDLGKKKKFDWKNYQEAALANASIEGLKYIFHDRALMNKVDKLLQLVSGSLPNNVKYVGVELLDGKPVGVFRDPQNALLINDQAGNWFKVVSENPVRLTSIQSPFQQ